MRLLTLIVALILVFGSTRPGDQSGNHAGDWSDWVNPVSTLAINDGLVWLGPQPGPDRTFGQSIGQSILGAQVEFHSFDLINSGNSENSGAFGPLLIRAGRNSDVLIEPGHVISDHRGDRDETTRNSEMKLVFGSGLVMAVGNQFRLNQETLHQVFDEVATGGRTRQSDRFSVRTSFRF